MAMEIAWIFLMGWLLILGIPELWATRTDQLDKDITEKKKDLKDIKKEMNLTKEKEKRIRGKESSILGTLASLGSRALSEGERIKKDGDAVGADPGESPSDQTSDRAGDGTGAGLVQGVEMTLKEFWRTLEKFGLVRIEAAGKPSDRSIHHAMAQVERADVDDNTVVEEYRKGYMVKDKVVRASMVAVSRKPGREEKAEREIHTKEEE